MSLKLLRLPLLYSIEVSFRIHLNLRIRLEKAFEFKARL